MTALAILVILILACNSVFFTPANCAVLNGTGIKLPNKRSKSATLGEKLDNLLWFSVRARRDATGGEDDTRRSTNKKFRLVEHNTSTKHSDPRVKISKGYPIHEKHNPKIKSFIKSDETWRAAMNNDLFKGNVVKRGHTAKLLAEERKISEHTKPKKAVDKNEEKHEDFGNGKTPGRNVNNDIKSTIKKTPAVVPDRAEQVTNMEDKAISGGEEELAEFWPKRSLDDTLSKRSNIFRHPPSTEDSFEELADKVAYYSGDEDELSGGESGSDYQFAETENLDSLEADSNGSGEEYLETGSGSGASEFQRLKSRKAQNILHKLDYGMYSGNSPNRLGHNLNRHKVHRSSSKFVPWQASALFPFRDPNMQLGAPTQGSAQYKFEYVKDAVKKGALCLDGSKPGFYLRQGSDEGENKWIIYLQGGAWCTSKQDCYERTQSEYGSSDKWGPLFGTEGILSPIKEDNSDFYNWNVAYVKYCDGASFAGNRTEPIKVDGKLIYFRGKRILSAVVDDLLAKGMKDAEEVVFTGTSAGGLSVILHADYIRDRMPKGTPVYSLADDGYFLDAASTTGSHMFREDMQAVCKLQGCSPGVNQNCIASLLKNEQWKCLFPQYFVKYVKSKLYIVNSLYDSWQIGNILGIECSTHVEDCSEKELEAIMKYKSTTIDALTQVKENSNLGLYAMSCLQHGEAMYTPRWNKIKVKGQSMSASFAAWMKSQGERLLIDPDDYPNNKSCL